MPSLPGVNEEFSADASGYLAAIQAMIDETKKFIDTVNDLHAAIDALPDIKEIEILVIGDALEEIQAIKEDLDSLDDRTVVVNVVYRSTGGPDIKDATQVVYEDVVGKGGDVTNVSENVDLSGVSPDQLKNEAAALNDLGDSAGRAYDRFEALVDSERVLAETNELLVALDQVLGEETGKVSESFDYFQAKVKAAGGSVNDFDVDVSGGMGTMLAFALAAKRAGDNVGGITIPIDAAKFGITGWGTAIHLVVMGIFEFSAVFIPAMVAAGAAASVLNQGFVDVYDGLKGVETAGEALGPMFGKTQGDMIGLGHSLQTAQNAADPDAYEILGEAIIGVNDATGHLNDQLGSVTHTSGTAAGGISSFGQMGLAVGGILEKFAADIDIDLQTGMSQFTGLISKGVQDLVEFGQILGNIGHAILNLASAMPGLAEIVLGAIDALSDFIKIISELPPMLITVVMGIEEAYRWSGLLVGVFGLLGRAIALVGTLGIPVIAKIGFNMGAMVANVITGIGDMVVNFVAMGERIGVFGEDVDKAATSLVGGLGNAASFMAGPWGAAVMLAVAGFTVLTIWALRTTSATEQFINATQQAVAAASNLQVLNTIGNEMAATTQKLAQASTQYSQALATQSQDMNSVESRYTGQSQAVMETSGNVQALTANQQKLYQESTNVISGAEQISKAYGISFVAALGLADTAGVKLVNGISGNSKAAEEARIQIQGLVQGYTEMNQSGTTLSNSMEAVSVQAQMQGTQVSKLNSAWDSFMSMATSLTSSFSQVNLDIQQMGNIAPAVGKKIQAFTGDTGMSVNQIANALKSFGGTSAQVWQAYDQSLSGAETFTDNMRTASAAGVVTSTQYTQAISGIVNQLLPYAKHSAAAASELSVLAQEAGYAGDGSFSSLKGWIDQTGGSTVKLGALVDNLTGKLSNVTAVAKSFAGTLQSDVLSAIANAAVGTASITGLTQKFTQSLEQNGAQAPQTVSAQNALQTAMEKLGFTQTEAKQTTDELSGAYNLNTGAAGTNAGATDISNGSFNSLATTLTGKSAKAFDIVRAHSGDLTYQLNNGLTPSIGGAGDKAKSTADGPMTQLQQMTESIHGWTQQLETVMKQWPTNEHTNVNVTGTGGANIKSNIPGVPGGIIQVLQGNLGLAGGGVIPGYSPGHDTVPAMLSPGEGILTPDAVRAIGGAAAIHSLNAQRFASGGIALPNVTGTAGHILSQSSLDITDAFRSVLSAAVQHFQTQYNSFAQTQTGNAPGGHYSGTLLSWLSAALTADGAPQSWLPALAWLANAESSGNPGAVDPILVDGENATGLLQTLPSTFAEFRNPAIDGGIWNPIANAAAAIRYIESTYGSPFNIPGMFVHDKGYDDGGWLMPGLTLARNNTGQPERVTAPGGEGGVVHSVVNLDGKTIFESLKPYVLQYNARNNGNGNITGAWAPNRNGNNTR
jgi:SLT domain-containing protein